MRPLVIWIGGLPGLWRLHRGLVATDRFLHRRSGGRLSLVRMGGLPGLMLSVRGRRSGELRQVPLLYVPDQGTWLVAGSNWGHPKPPAWVYNLAAADRAEINVEGRRIEVVPEELAGAARGEAWATMCRYWPNYATYAERTDREIRVFRLSAVRPG